VLHAAGVDAGALLAALASAFPPPRRHVLLRAERRIGRRTRRHDLILRYQRTTGRAAVPHAGLAALIGG
jgi:hypothetical protein